MYRHAPSMITSLLVVLAPVAASGDDAQVIVGVFTWPDQGVGLDPNGLPFHQGERVEDLLVYHGPDGPRLIVAGSFWYAGGQPAEGIAAWNGKAWFSLEADGSAGGTVYALVDANGNLYAGGAFTSLGKVEVKGIARWDGQQWSNLGTGLNGAAWGIAWADGKSAVGPALYVCGAFGNAGGIAAGRIAKWNGEQWSNLGTGCSDAAAAVAIFDDGGGSAVYVGGYFDYAGGVLVNRIAKWDGQSWAALGSGLNGFVEALAVFDDGSGEALYVGGVFTVNDAPAINNLARWDGKAWSEVGSGLGFQSVSDLEVLDDGSGPKLYAFGLNLMHRWDGVNWTRYEPYPSPGYPVCVEMFDSGAGPQLHIGGAFPLGEPPDNIWKNIARFTPGFACGDFNNDGVTDQKDLGILLAAYNCPKGKGCLGDTDGDGDVDQKDLGTLLAHFGQKCG